MYFSVNGNDMSAFITEDSFTYETEPLFDETGEYINLYGQRVRQRTGSRTSMALQLSGVTEAAARVLKTAFANGSAAVRVFAPDSEEMTASCESLALTLTGIQRDGTGGTSKLFGAKLRMSAETLDCL
ncbi:MAG: hypothetical protein J6F31_02740 [Oscillospiraceae bacterium]|nr:hypothetical protein [Oscillospiraceae bacterium]